MQMQTIGLSSDGRTNVWRLRCDCSKSWVPPTTMMAHQRVTCPHCNAEYVADYNEKTMEKARN